MNRKTKYDLEERTLTFVQQVRSFARIVPKRVDTIDDVKQLIRASGSVGANYIEANEAFSRKDFKFRIKICRKESKETRYWLKLLYLEDKHELAQEKKRLIQEASELLKIFSSIISNVK